MDNGKCCSSVSTTDIKQCAGIRMNYDGHSNQCIYVKSGEKNRFILSIDIPIAGSADYKAPGGSIGEVRNFLTYSGGGHQEHDVFPFRLALTLDKVKLPDFGRNITSYYSIRPIW